MSINQGFGIAQVKEEGATYYRYDIHGNKVEYIQSTQEDYMWGEYPTVSELIEQLSKLNPDAKVCYYFDSHIHGSIDRIYESKGGAVILTTDDEMSSMQEYDLPK